MRLLAFLPLAATSFVIAFPTIQTSTGADFKTLQDLASQTQHSDLCSLPVAGQNCAGATMKDVIIDYKNATQSQRDVILGAAKDAGASVAFDYQGFGFSGMVPNRVVQLIKVAGNSHGVTVYENACSGIPWCGEAPC